MSVATKQFGRIRTPIGTVQVESWGVSLFAGEREIACYAEAQGFSIEAKAFWAELDNLGRTLYVFPANCQAHRALDSWIDALLAMARDEESDNQCS